MISYRITSAALGVALFTIIFILVRRGKLQEKFSVIWFFLGFVIVLLGLFPSIVDAMARALGITYSPTLLFVLALGILLIQNLYLSISASRNDIRIKTLSQHLAVTQKQLEELVNDGKAPRRSIPTPPTNGENPTAFPP